MDDKSLTDELVQLCLDGINGANREGTVVIFNEAARRMFQRGKQEVLDKLHLIKIC
jgi:signal transduction histidine kinase